MLYSPCAHCFKAERKAALLARLRVLRYKPLYQQHARNNISSLDQQSLSKPTKGEPMPVERTLSIIKPDATARNITGKIIAKFEEAGLRIIAQKRVHWDETDAAAFYAVHKERPFFQDLVKSMTAGPIVLQVLEGENAVAKNREIMGATNPANATPGTIRKEFAENIERNSVHGSDSVDNAQLEIALVFQESEIVG
jgi:nucleoside-diphosphate kinase